MSDELELRGVLARLKCWHRLTGEEAQELVDFCKLRGITGDGRGETHCEYPRCITTASVCGGACSHKTYTTPQQEQAAPGAVTPDGPPFGTKRKAAMAIYTPPFRFDHGYIYDSENHMVADQDGFGGKVAEAVVARVRGWGRIGYMPNPEQLQDEVGQMIADALTAYYAAAPKQETRE